MEEYISKSLDAGIICLSPSPTGAGVFFVEKKDKSLWPCIDCRGLNDIIVILVVTPILRILDPALQFVVEVDAWDVGVGAVLLQRAASDQKLHPCAFFHQLREIMT